MIYTNHKPLTFISKSSHTSPRAAQWIDGLSELSLRIVHLAGPLNGVADTLLQPPVRETTWLTDADMSRMTTWLCRVAPHVIAHECSEAAYASLTAGKQLEFLKCAHCSAAHLDQQEYAVKDHWVHTCSACGKNWRH